MAKTYEEFPGIATEDDHNLMKELMPVVEQQYEAHLARNAEGSAGEWFPHEMIPYSVGKTFKKGEVWTPESLPLDPEVISSLVVGTLTEDNLPYYTQEINRAAGINDKNASKHEALLLWNRRWTAEEAKHGTTMHTYLEVARLLDLRDLERARMHQMSSGQVPHSLTAIGGIAYVTLQEKATQISHINTGKIVDRAIAGADTEGLEEPELERREIIRKAGREIMNRVAKDESQHFAFYRGLIDAGVQIDPSTTVRAIEREVREFEMPGAGGIPGFNRHAFRIAKAWVYNLPIHHQQILEELIIKRWKIDTLDGLDDDGKRAQESLVEQISDLGAQAVKFADRYPDPAAERRAA